MKYMLLCLVLLCKTVLLPAQTQSADLTEAITQYDNSKYSAALPLLLKCADNKEAKAYRYLAMVYYWGGDGIGKNCTECFNWLKRSAAANDAEGQLLLADLYEKGNCITADYSEALRLYRQSAVAGNPQGMIHAGMMYEKGKGVAIDYATAKSWYNKAAATGNYLAKMQSQDRLTEIKKAEDIAVTQRAAQQQAEEEQRRLEAQKLQDEENGICYAATRYGGVKMLCNSMQTYADEETKTSLVSGGILAEDTHFKATLNYTLVGVEGYDIVAAKGTKVFFNTYPGTGLPPNFRPEPSDIWPENKRKVQSYAYQQSVGAISQVTIKQPGIFSCYGRFSSFTAPAGSTISFSPEAGVNNSLLEVHYYVHAITLGEDIDDPYLGHLAKGTGLVTQDHYDFDVWHKGYFGPIRN